MQAGYKAKAYADTSVPVERSKEKIRALLVKHGASAFGVQEDFNAGRIGFHFQWVKGGKTTAAVPFIVSLRIEAWKRPGDQFSLPIARQEQRIRQVWRALYYYLKSQLEAVDFGLVKFEDVFLSHIQTQDGLTVGEVLRPHLDDGSIIRLLPSGSTTT